MHIMMLASECAPIAKVGGLADVVAGLANELARRPGVEVEIVLPKYAGLDYAGLVDCRLIWEHLPVPFFDRTIDSRAFEARVRGLDPALRLLLVEPRSEHRFFDREDLYGYRDDGPRFAWFARAALELIRATGRHPDILHCHDWQTGLVPVLLYEEFEANGLRGSRACFTLHNVHHQGVVGVDVLRQVRLDPGRLMTPDRLLHHAGGGGVNQLQGGIVFSNTVTTVSRTYAEEIRRTELGCGLQRLLERYAHKLEGVLNGVDDAVWNPMTDSYIEKQYDIETIAHKADNKKALRKRLSLADVSKPIVAVISRLDRQKGCQLMKHALYTSLRRGAQFVLLGRAPDPAIDEEFQAIKREFSGNPDCHFELTFDDELAHWIYAAADLILVPSHYEPCGLTQMIGMKYGTVPVVRRTGGLAETVFDANFSDRGFDEVNGYTFADEDGQAVDSALVRAIGLWYQHPEYFRKLQQNGMRYDSTWRARADRYLELYRSILGW